jgi:hypothetical protein
MNGDATVHEWDATCGSLLTPVGSPHVNKQNVCLQSNECCMHKLLKRMLHAQIADVYLRMAAGSDEGALVVIEQKPVYDSLGNLTADLTLLGVWSDRRIQLSRYVLRPCKTGENIRLTYTENTVADFCLFLFKSHAQSKVEYLRYDLGYGCGMPEEDSTCAQDKCKYMLY